MNWIPWGKGDTSITSSDGRYSLHHTSRGWQAWQRLPCVKRIGDLYELSKDAKGFCEIHSKEQAA